MLAEETSRIIEMAWEDGLWEKFKNLFTKINNNLYKKIKCYFLQLVEMEWAG